MIASRSYTAARAALDRVLAREPGGPTLEVARSLERIIDLDPTLLPALQALERAVDAGADREAAAILARLMLRRPRGRLLEIAQAYRRILDGRALVSSLRLRLECRPEIVAKPSPDAPPGARFTRLFLVAESAIEAQVDIEPGPATLLVTRSIVDRRGVEQDAVETRTFAKLRRLHVERGKPTETPLALFFLASSPGALAVRLRFEIDLRSGTAQIPAPGPGGKARELPAMRLRAAAAEETALEASLASMPAAAPEDLAALISGASPVELRGALAIAVRIAPGERARALDLLAPLVDTAPESAVQAFVPALRWIALTSEPGGDAQAWRAWLGARSDRKAGERPRLLLPPARADVKG